MGRLWGWLAGNLGRALLCVVAPLAVIGPLSAVGVRRSGADALSVGDHLGLTVIFGGLALPFYLALVASISRARRFRLWALAASPLLGLPVWPVFLLITDPTGQSVVASYLLFGALVRPLPQAVAPGGGPAVFGSPKP